jgi:hypothetical protein
MMPAGGECPGAAGLAVSATTRLAAARGQGGSRSHAAAHRSLAAGGLPRSGAAVVPLGSGTTNPGCRARIGNAYLTRHDVGGRQVLEVGVTAHLRCRSRVNGLSLQVTLWKTGLLFDHKVAQTKVTARSAVSLTDSLTRATCRSHASSRFYGVAHATVSFRGRSGGTWTRSPDTIALPCGT